jgi:hypothetical protein
VSLINFANPRYGVNFLQMANSVHPWFHGAHTVTSVVGRTLEGAVQGAIAAVAIKEYSTFDSTARHTAISVCSSSCRCSGTRPFGNGHGFFTEDQQRAKD